MSGIVYKQLMVNSQGYYLDEWLICALNQVKFGTYVSDTYSFAYFCPKQNYYGHILRHLKWVKTTDFQILQNATSLSATYQHSSKWYPRLVKVNIIPSKHLRVQTCPIHYVNVSFSIRKAPLEISEVTDTLCRHITRDSTVMENSHKWPDISRLNDR